MSNVAAPIQPAPAQPKDASRRGSVCESHGVRVVVRPVYMPQHSEPTERKFVWAYRVVITNQSERAIQLLRRHWTIVDSVGRSREVGGDGVIGAQPTIKPGHSFEYSSHCPLETPWGTMEGRYVCRITTGEGSGNEIVVRVARFLLTPPVVQ